MADVTRILAAVGDGDARASAELLPLVYDELRRLAAEKLAHERVGQTLQPTALVHEAYLRLAGPEGGRSFADRGHFLAAAAAAMRRILIDRARSRRRVRHGGGLNRVELFADAAAVPTDDDQLLLLDQSLTRLAEVRPQAAEVVRLRFFAGLTIDEAAPVVGLSPRTARRLWVYARAWMRRDMERAADTAP
jgi:RNA polymerase sigma factor (TIGR02999 family)